jgi:hypothetical protein
MNALIKPSRNLIRTGQTVLLAGMLVSLAGCSTPSKDSTDASKAKLMFVQIADNLKVDASSTTFRLVGVSPQTLYFSDRPVRIAGHIKMPNYLEEWTTKAGKDNFSANPPNAILSVYEPGQPENTVVVVEITNPVVDGADLLYTYKVIEGTMPAAGGATALFIDRIGVGGGVGVGYHGVGVGRRGPGVL